MDWADLHEDYSERDYQYEEEYDHAGYGYGDGDEDFSEYKDEDDGQARIKLEDLKRGRKWKEMTTADDLYLRWNAIIRARDHILSDGYMDVMPKSVRESSTASRAINVLKSVKKFCKDFGPNAYKCSLGWTMGILLDLLLPYATGSKTQCREMHRLSREALDAVNQIISGARSLPKPHCSPSGGKLLSLSSVSTEVQAAITNKTTVPSDLSLAARLADMRVQECASKIDQKLEITKLAGPYGPHKLYIPFSWVPDESDF
jgi:hypothetical protein